MIIAFIGFYKLTNWQKLAGRIGAPPLFAQSGFRISQPYQQYSLDTMDIRSVCHGGHDADHSLSQARTQKPGNYQHLHKSREQQIYFPFFRSPVTNQLEGRYVRGTGRNDHAQRGCHIVLITKDAAGLLRK